MVVKYPPAAVQQQWQTDSGWAPAVIANSCLHCQDLSAGETSASAVVVHCHLLFPARSRFRTRHLFAAGTARSHKLVIRMVTLWRQRWGPAEKTSVWAGPVVICQKVPPTPGRTVGTSSCSSHLHVVNSWLRLCWETRIRTAEVYWAPSHHFCLTYAAVKTGDLTMSLSRSSRVLASSAAGTAAACFAVVVRQPKTSSVHTHSLLDQTRRSLLPSRHSRIRCC